jgi:predicted GIY-YIG superfamily endonuclease
MEKFRKKRGYWNNKEILIEEALKYNNKTEFIKKSNGAYNSAVKLGILDEICSHMLVKNEKWDIEKIKKEALKYNTRTEFAKSSASLYEGARHLGILDDVCSHMIKILNKRGYWNDINNIKSESIKYKTRVEFSNMSGSAYSSARHLGILDDVCSHMIKLKRMDSYIYKAVFDDNSIYIGITYNFNKRKKRHLNDNNSAIYKYIQSTGKIPKWKLLISEPISINKAALFEKELIKKAKLLGLNVLNRSRGGEMGGKSIKWVEETIHPLALMCKNRSEFCRLFGSAYYAAHKLSIIDKVCSHMIELRKHKGYWNYDTLMECSIRYENRKAFRKESLKAYKSAYKLGLLDVICSHMRD